jgi:catechol 2,3-dioxygenase-like lactoylglutathione lyase family enzyme
MTLTVIGMSSSLFRRLHKKKNTGGIERVTPILNVSNLQDSFAWFEKLGWRRSWDWGDPPDFGGVCAGDFEIYLCENGQGGDGGAWIMLAVDDVEAVHRRCVANGLEITSPPADMPWNMREMHVRHPDGHVIRIGQGRE